MIKQPRNEFVKALDAYGGLAVVGIFMLFIIPLSLVAAIVALPFAIVGICGLWLLDKCGVIGNGKGDE